MIEMKYKRWHFIPLAMIPLFSVLPTIVRNSDTVAAIWLRTHVAAGQVVLVLAGVVLLAGIAAGVHAWKEAKADA